LNTQTTLECGQVHCHPDTGCALGEIPVECPHYASSKTEDSETLSMPSAEGLGVPWSGSEFGIDDIAWVASRQRPTLLVPVGAHKAGKTTFLASLYIGLLRGAKPEGWEQLGSYTLGGWEKLASYLRHTPDGIGPGFPPHTPVTDRRTPGWLHLGFRNTETNVRDLLLADAPGEWFSRWAVDENDSTAEGARWAANRGDVFLLFVDSEGLTSPDRRNVAEQLELLANRLSGVLDDRPLAVVWAKSDKEIPQTLREDVELALSNALPGSKHFQTTVFNSGNDSDPTQQFWDVLDWCVSHSGPMNRQLSPLASVNPADPFLSFRG